MGFSLFQPFTTFLMFDARFKPNVHRTWRLCTFEKLRWNCCNSTSKWWLNGCSKLFDKLWFTSRQRMECDFIKITADVISIDETSGLVHNACAGAISMFIGTAFIINIFLVWRSHSNNLKCTFAKKIKSHTVYYIVNLTLPILYLLWFVVSGTTRDTFNGKNVVQLEYEAYVPMAEKELQKICQEIRNEWNVVKIAVVHRIGWVTYCCLHVHASKLWINLCFEKLEFLVPISSVYYYDLLQVGSYWWS